MKTLPKKINKTIEDVLGDYQLTRVICEELCIGVTRYYICGRYAKGYFAAWNDDRYFCKSDIETFNTCDDAWDYLDKNLVL